MEHIASAFFVLNVLLFLVFTAITVTRYIMYPWMLWRMLSYPAQCAPNPTCQHHAFSLKMYPWLEPISCMALIPLHINAKRSIVFI